MTAETRLGRVTLDVGEAVASGVRSNSALMAPGLRDDLCHICCSTPYRPAAEEASRLTGRAISGDELEFHQLASACGREGTRLAEAKEAEARRIVGEWGDAFGADGVPGATCSDELPEGLRQRPASVLAVDPAEICGAPPGGTLTLGDALGLDVAELGESLPYGGGSPGKRARRGSRTETPAKAKAAVTAGYVRWLNLKEEVPAYRKVLVPWNLELDSSECCYVSIDAVLVEEQCAEHVRGGKGAAKERRTYVKHWNARVEADGRAYGVTSVNEGTMYLELVACLLENGLITRRLVFLIDGETRIRDAIERWFAPWGHDTYLDWHHLEEKIREYMSRIVVARRVDDPDADVELYSRGPRRGQPKPRPQTSLSRLFAKEALLIAWVGNVAHLVAYVRGIPDDCVKSEAAREALLGYLERKAGMITCYALRRKVGLRNSSNGSEQQNQLLVSQRQKQPLMTWREPGSGSLAQLSALYRNGESELWFSGGEVTFRMDLAA